MNMSVDLKYFIEARSSDGKWRLVTWTDYEGETHCERYGSLTLRDELTGYMWDSSKSLPDDISDELKTILISMANEKSMMFHGDEHKVDWRRMFECVGLDRLYERCNEAHEQLKEYLVNRAGSTAMDDIARRLDRIEKIIAGKPVQEKKKNHDDDDEKPIDYRTAMGYVLDEEMFDYVYLMCECAKINGIATNFMPYLRMGDGENVRIIYYCC